MGSKVRGAVHEEWTVPTGEGRFNSFIESEMKGRRQFLRDAIYLPPLIAALFAAPLMISCGDDEDPPTASVDCGGGGGGTGNSGAISDNHCHSVSITQVQRDTPTELILTFSGGTHTHTLGLTLEQVQDIAADLPVPQLSSLNGHNHLVTFNV